MKEPRRLMHGEDPLARELLNAGRSEEPRHRTIRRMLVAVGSGSALTVVSSAAAGTSAATVGAGAVGASAVGIVGVAKWGVLGLALGLASAGVAAQLGDEPAVVRATPPVVQRQAPILREPRAAPKPEPPRASVAEVPAPSKAPTGAPRRPASPRSTLASETRLIDAARAALAAGDWANALARLDVHRRDYPDGALELEAAYLRMEAQALGDDPESAADTARELLADQAGAVHANRARAILQRVEAAKP